MKRKFVDIHVHPSLKPYNNYCYEGIQPTMREKFPYDEKWEDPAQHLCCLIRKGIKELERKSQANLDACRDGQVKCVFLSLYPSERPFFDAARSCCLIRLALPKRKMKYLAQAVSGFPVRKIEKIMNRVDKGTGVDYYREELLPLLDYVIKQTGKKTEAENGYVFKIASDYHEFKTFTQEEGTVTGILTVEGANSLGNYEKHFWFGKRFEELDPAEQRCLEESFEQNIMDLKDHNGEKDLTPFFVTFCHHFNNLLAGHSRSLSARMSLILNQKPGRDLSFNDLGKKVLELFLDRTNGRRILIDTKHMSLETRREYHRMVDDRRKKGDPVPIICSHTAVNGWRSWADAARFGPSARIDRKAYFSPWEINLNDEEILDIYDSDGMIGLVLHEGRMPGGKFKKRAGALKRKISRFRPAEMENNPAQEELKKIYTELIWSNIFHIIRFIAKNRIDKEGRPASGWKIVSLGSDFDGAIDPFDSFDNITRLPDLAEGMTDYLKDERNPVYYAHNGRENTFQRKELEKLFFNAGIEEIVDDIFFGNVDVFLSKYFTDDYLSPAGSRRIPGLFHA